MESSRLLLVEDTCPLAQLYRSYLEGEGYEIEHTASGKSAIRILGEKRPSVLLLDLNLPDISGIDVLNGPAGELRRPGPLVRHRYRLAAVRQ